MVEGELREISEENNPRKILGILGPYDMPLRIRFFRRIKTVKNLEYDYSGKTVKGLEGHTLEIHAEKWGVKVFIHTTMPRDRSGTGRSLTLFLQGPDDEEPLELETWS